MRAGCKFAVSYRRGPRLLSGGEALDQLFRLLGAELYMLEQDKATNEIIRLAV
jgi:hypothetical protein